MFHNGFFMGGMWFGWIFWIAVIVLIIFLILRVVNKNNQSNNSTETHLDILKKRYARGEISKEEFENMKKDLQ